MSDERERLGRALERAQREMVGTEERAIRNKTERLREIEHEVRRVARLDEKNR